MRFSPALLLFFASTAFAADAVVTLQYESKTAVFAAGTSRLEAATVKSIHDAFPGAKAHTVNAFEGQIGKLSREELAKNFREAREALQSLNNGALLVLNCHSSISQVGVPTEDGGTKLILWREFWGHFGILRPPRLALVALNGCVGAMTEDGVKTEASEWDLEKLRCTLSAQALISGKRNIATAEAQADLTNVMTKMRADLKGWDLDLSAETGAFKVMHVLTIRVGKLYAQDGLTFNKLKKQAITYGRPSEVTSDGARDVVAAHEDDIDSNHLASDAVPLLWDAYDEKAEAGPRPFCFEFKPRGEIVKVEIEVRVKAFGSDPARDSICFWAGEDPTLICKDFSPFLKEEGKVTVSFPSAAQLKANPSATLKDTNRALYDRLMAGRLRCVIADQAWLESASMTLEYAPAK